MAKKKPKEINATSLILIVPSGISLLTLAFPAFQPIKTQKDDNKIITKIAINK
jgi:hypothetical protein